MKIPLVIYAEKETLHEKMDTSNKNPEKLSTTKINKHSACSYSLFTHCSFDARKTNVFTIKEMTV